MAPREQVAQHARAALPPPLLDDQAINTELKRPEKPRFEDPPPRCGGLRGQGWRSRGPIFRAGSALMTDPTLQLALKRPGPDWAQPSPLTFEWDDPRS
jgi:hypothetical protein